MGICKISKTMEKEKNKDSSEELQRIWTFVMLIAIFFATQITVKYYLPYEMDNFLHRTITIPWCMELLIVLITLFSKPKSLYRRTFSLLAIIGIPILIIVSLGSFYIYALGSGPFR